MELFLGQSFVTFDGKVIEAFSNRSGGGGRVHVAIVSQISVGGDGDDLYVQLRTVWGGSPFLLRFPASQRQWADWLVQEVEKARASYAQQR